MSPKKGIEKRWNQIKKKLNFVKKYWVRYLMTVEELEQTKKMKKNEECFDRSVYKNQWMGVRLYGNLSMMFWVEMCL